MDKDVILKWKMPEKPECFFGREQELQKITDLFAQGNHVVFIQGVGGIGKSELAAQYAITHRQQYEVIVFSNCIQDLKTMIASDKEVPIYNLKRNTYDDYFLETEDEYFERKFSVLSQIVTENALLIVDNFNCPDDPYLDEFLKLKCDILITTRRDWSAKHLPILSLGEIRDENEVRKIFEHYYLPKDQQEQAQIQEIINLVDKHTLSVEWIAKQLNEHTIDLPRLKTALQQQAGTVTDKTQKDSILLSMLSEVFRVKDLSEAEQNVLRFLCFVPYTGISKEELVRRGKKGTHTAVLKLLGSSWMKQIELDVVTLHPIVAETVAHELHPSWENMSVFVASMVEDFLDDDLPVQKIDSLLVIANNMFRMLGTEDPGAISLLIGVSHAYLKRYRKYEVAIQMLVQAKELEEKEMEDTRVKLSLCKEQSAADLEYESLKNQLIMEETQRSKTIQQIGEIYFLCEKYEKALEWYMKLSRSPVVDVYCDIAKVYAKVNEYKKALEYIQAGLKMKKYQYGTNEIPLVESYLLMASIYLQMQDSYMVEKWMKEAERIAQEQMNQQEQSDFYYEYAVLLKKMGRIEEALQYDQKTWALRRKLYGDENLAVIRSYAAMAVDYYKLGDFESALECTLREIELRKKLRRVKRRLYMSTSRLLGFVDVNNLPEDTQERLKVFMNDFNRILKENPKEGQEMMKQ